MKNRLTMLLSALLVFAALLFLWQMVIWIFHVPIYMLPSPWRVAATVVEKFPDLWASLLISAEAAAGGLLASIVVGVMVALIFARSAWIRKLLFPYTILLQTVPILALAPLIIVWVGQGLLAVGVVTFIICLAPIIANATQGLISVDENLVQLFLMHNATQGQILRRLRLPHSLPYLFVGVRISSGIAVIGAITGEWFAGSGQVGRGGLALLGHHRFPVAFAPAVVVRVDAAQHMLARLRRRKQIVSPLRRELARKVRVVRVRHQPPSVRGLQPQHRQPSTRPAAADSCHLCSASHSKNITRKKNTNPSAVAANTSANR